MTEERSLFVAETARRAAQAASAGLTSSLQIAPAGIAVAVTLVGAGVIDELEPAFIKAAAPASTAAEIWSFDHAASGISPPPPPWPPSAYRPGEEIDGWTEGPVFASFDTAHAMLSVADSDAGIGVQWARSAAGLAPWEGGGPLRHILRWLLARHGLHLLHGAVVGTERGGVLLVGKGGSGKSTSALACVDGGMRFLCDDYFLLRPEPEPVGYPLFAVAKADAAAVAMLGGIATRAPGARTDWRGKYRLPMADLVCDSMPILAIVQPRRAATTGTPRAGGAREARKEIITSSLSQLPGASAATLAALKPVFDRLPCYELDVGPDLERIPMAITALIDDLAGTR